MELHDRNVLITGGASGIGLEQARQLAANNNVIVGSRDRAKLERAVSGGSRLRALELDVKSEDAARSAIASAVEQFGGLDILVNAAGVLHHAPFADQAAEAVDDEVAVNLVGSMRMTRLALPHLRAANAGAVVFLSSALALAASPELASYASTKAAIHLIARSLRAEFAGQVRVFEVLPPFVDTGMATGLGRTKLAPSDVASQIVDGLRHDRFEIRIGPVNALAALARTWPTAADWIISREIGTA